MLKAKNALVLFDYWSLCVGMSVFAEERGISFEYLNLIRAGLQLILAFICAFFSALNLYSSDSSTPLYRLNVATFYFMQPFYILFIHREKNEIRCQFNDFFVRLTEHQKKKFQVLASIITCFAFSINVWTLAASVASLVQVHTETWLLDVYLNYVAIISMADQNVHGFTWIFLLIILCYYNCKNQLQKIRQTSISESAESQQISGLIADQAFLILQSVFHVNRVTGIPLLIIVGYIFIGLSGVLSLNIKTEIGSNLWNTSEIFYIGSLCFGLLSLVVLVTVLTKKLQSLRTSVLAELSQGHSDNTTVKWKIVIEILSRPNLFDFTVMSLFPLDMNLIFKFASMQVSFTILMLQLESKISRYG